MRRRTFLAASAASAFGSWPASAADEPANRLLAPWAGPFGGVPPFDKVKLADFASAALAAMAEEIEQIDSIASNPRPPTFDNTIAALETTGSSGNRVQALYIVWNGTLSSPELRAIDRVLVPRRAAHADQILQNAGLFRRIDAVYQRREALRLTAEQKRLTEVHWTNFVRGGARATGVAKTRLAQINLELASLYTTFNQNLLVEENDHTLFLAEADLSGLTADLRAVAATAAQQRRRPGDYAVLNIRASVEPFLTYSDRRDLREKVWTTFYRRCDNGDGRDNKAAIRKILRLRAERAKLLGFPTHAHWSLAGNSMAGTPEAAMALMMRVWPAAVARVRQEVAEMQAIADGEKAGIRIAPWDYRYYAEKVRQARFDLDLEAVKPYLQLDSLRDALHWTAGQTYGLSFRQRTDIPVQHPSVTVYEVLRENTHVGLWYFDPFARPGKRSGAWMHAYRQQQKFGGRVTAITSNNSNFLEGEPGQPVLISLADARTLFHEFGHALHALNSAVTYPSLAGTRVVRDYVEFPSQVNEAWLLTPQVLSRFARHYRTGAPLPQALIDKIQRTQTFRQGFDVTENLASALIDLKLHLAGGVDIDPAVFERETLAELGMPAEVAMRHRLPHFPHLFASDGYSAGYYAYIWSEVIAQDAIGAFEAAPGKLYDKAVAKRLHDNVMSVGNTVDPRIGYRRFRGRDPDVNAYLRAKGFATA